MRLFYTILFTGIIQFAFSQQNNLPIPAHGGQALSPLDADNKKVIIADDENSLEISPYSSFNNGLLLEPVNRAAGRGISTAFYIRDTASWSFYTNAQKRLAIKGDGLITFSSPLLVNTETADGISMLRVNGAGRFDTAFYLKANSDSQTFISMHRNVKVNGVDIDDSISPYTSTPTAWAVNHNIPVFRIRHPIDILNHPPGYNTSILRDFMILPYQYGIAIEYNGIIECWVGEWSIHKGVNYFDVEGKGNGWGGVLWVGDDVDEGGVRSTARNNTTLGGNVAYGEISVEKFGGSPNGDFRLRLPSTQNQFHFVYGERGSENVIAKITNQGLIVPEIATVDSAISPEKAQIVFDSTESAFKGYNGSEWVGFSGNNLLTGSYTLSANGTDDTFYIPHGLSAPPVYYTVIATSPDAGNFSYVTANATHLIVHYTNAPAAGIVNLSWNWQVKR